MSDYTQLSPQELSRQRQDMAETAAALTEELRQLAKSNPRRAEVVEQKMVLDSRLKRINAEIKQRNVAVMKPNAPWVPQPAEEEAGPAITAVEYWAGLAMHALITTGLSVPMAELDKEKIANYAWEMAEVMDDHGREDGDGEEEKE